MPRGERLSSYSKIPSVSSAGLQSTNSGWLKKTTFLSTINIIYIGI